jgi:hypothetical protein
VAIRGEPKDEDIRSIEGRGCWHTRMSWPIREGDHSYQGCLECGIKRLFDEKKFRGNGRYGYDVKELITRERAIRMRQRRKTA